MGPKENTDSLIEKITKEAIEKMQRYKNLF